MQAPLMLKICKFFFRGGLSYTPVGFVRSPRQDKCNFKPGVLYRTKANKCHDDDDLTTMMMVAVISMRSEGK